MTITEKLYNGRYTTTMAKYEAIETLEENVDYELIDYPKDGITNSQMAFALTCTRLFPVGTTFVCTDSGMYTLGHTYKMTITNSVKTWQDITAQLSGGQIITKVYDNTTLGDHLSEIMGLTNVENGGTLLSIGFKTKTASVLANATKATITNGANPVISTSSEAVLKPQSFYSFRSADISSGTLTLNGPNGLDGCSSTNLELTSTTAIANGCSQRIDGSNLILTSFAGINLASIQVEHLVIDYFTV